MRRRRHRTQSAKMSNLRIGHFSDSHLGYEAYPALNDRGLNQRGVDVVRAFKNVCDDINSWDPPLVIHSGDVTERPKVEYRYMLAALQGFAELAGTRPDGSRRQVVVIAGNHELPRRHMEACWLDLLRHIPGLHIVTRQYETVRFDHKKHDSDPVLDNVAVHCLPHDTLKTVDFAGIQPYPGLTNILTAHGVAGGSELFTRSLGREYHIPSEVLARDWEYVALGHWHKRGPVSVTGVKTEQSNVWYAGSAENISFRDLRNNSADRGWLAVQHNSTSNELTVTPRNNTIRRMFRLTPVDGADLGPEQLEEQLVKRISQADIDDAVIQQPVRNVHRDLWALVDTSSARDAAKKALHYEIQVKYVDTADDGDTNEPVSGLAGLDEVLEQQAALLAETSEHKKRIVDDVIKLAKTLIGNELSGSGDTTPGQQNEPDQSPDTDGTTPSAEASGADGGADGEDKAGNGTAPDSRTGEAAQGSSP